MTISELVIKECEARRRGDIEEANRPQALRWQAAMGKVINSENTRQRRP